MLNPEGVLAMIVPADSIGKLTFNAILHHLYPQITTSITTRTGKPPRRALVSFSLQALPPVTSVLTISDSDGFTPEYRNLTHDFYLEF